MPRERILLVTTVGLLSLLIIDRFVITPIYELWQRKTDEISELESKLSKASLLLERKAISNEYWNRAQAVMLPEIGYENALLTCVNDWREKSQLNIERVKPELSKPSKIKPPHLICTLNARGTFDQIIQFLLNMRQAQIGIALERCELISKNDHGHDLLLNLRFSCLINHQNERNP